MKLRLSLSRSKKTSSPMEISEVASPSVLVKELSATFEVFDRDADGRISKGELGTVLSSLGDDLNDAELDELMSKVDGDGDGFIDLQEFISFHTGKSSARTSTSSTGSVEKIDETWNAEKIALQAAFDVFDADKNGYISAEELQRVMCSLGDKQTSLAECRHMINCVDKDGDEMVNFTEFQCLMSLRVFCVD